MKTEKFLKSISHRQKKKMVHIFLWQRILFRQSFEAQSAEVDTISGATFSSTGIKEAVAQALEEAANQEVKTAI